MTVYHLLKDCFDGEGIDDQSWIEEKIQSILEDRGMEADYTPTLQECEMLRQTVYVCCE